MASPLSLRKSAIVLKSGIRRPVSQNQLNVPVAGEGHWITGTIMIVVAYAASLFLVERLFRIVKPKLLTLPWFARLWDWFVALRGKAVGLFRRA
jgi:hypothetical protein